MPEGASLGTAGGLPCLGVGTGKLGLVVAEDSTARWLERRTTAVHRVGGETVRVEDDATTYASPPRVEKG